MDVVFNQARVWIIGVAISTARVDSLVVANVSAGDVFFSCDVDGVVALVQLLSVYSDVGIAWFFILVVYGTI